MLSPPLQCPKFRLELYFSLLLLPSLLPPFVLPRCARCCQCAVLLPRCAHLTFCCWLAARCCKDDPSLDRKDKLGNDGGKAPIVVCLITL